MVIDAYDDAVRRFHSLPQQEQAAAIYRLAVAGYLPHDIAALTQIALEQIERVLAEQAAA